MKQLHEDRKKQDEIIVRLLEEQQKLLSRMVPGKPEATPEEQEAQVEAERQRMLADPDGYFKKREAELLKKATEEATAKSKSDMATQMGFSTIEQMESHHASVQAIARLEGDKEAYPLMQDADFRKSMGDKANLQEIAKLYPKEAPSSAILKDPLFWHSAYQRAALSYLAKPKDAGTPPNPGEPPAPMSITGSPPNTPPKSTGPKSGLEAEWDKVMEMKTGVL